MTIAVAVLLLAVPQAPSAGERAVRVSTAERAACMPDAMRLCRSSMPNVRNVVQCFLGQKPKLSRRCRAVLANYGL